MRLVPTESPRVLPDFVSCYSARLVEGDYSTHFAAGRHCAGQAIAQLGGDGRIQVGRGAAGEPVWPGGFTGSITHTGDFFCAAVARTSDASSIGIDAERIIEPDRAERIAHLILLPQEGMVGGALLSPALRVSLLFSIKEAVFKCLFPLVQKRFYYDAMAVTEMSPDDGTFRGVLVSSLSDRFAPGYALWGRFAVDERRVYAGTCLDPRP